LKTATRPQMFGSKAKVMSAVTQRSLHTPLGQTKSKDDAYKVRFAFF
jgi:hypothetical protein